MPSSKKRINLTVPDSLYDWLQAYKEKTGTSNDAPLLAVQRSEHYLPLLEWLICVGPDVIMNNKSR